MKSWVKLYTEINRDPKMVRLTWAHKGIWAALLALAGEVDVRNGDGQETGQIYSVEDTALIIRCDIAEFTEAVKVFLRPTAEGENGMLYEQNGMLFITNYGKRQARPPSARPEATKERKRQQRTRESQGSHEEVTTPRESVTPLDSDSDLDSDLDSEVDTAPDKRAHASSGKNAVRKALEVYFIRKTKLPRPQMNTAKQKKAAGERWWQPLRRIAELVDQDLVRGTKMIDEALKRLEGLTVSAPQSILKTIEFLVAEEARGRAPPMSTEDEWLASYGE